MPYNYVLDGRTRATLTSVPWENSVIIFDEAHNVEVQLCRLGYRLRVNCC